MFSWADAATQTVAFGNPFLIGTGSSGTINVNSQPTVIYPFSATINSVIGSIFNITRAGTYSFDYETSLVGSASIALYAQATSLGLPTGTNQFPIIPGSIAGSGTSLTWVHGRWIAKITVPTMYYVSPTTNTPALSKPGNYATSFLIRLSIVQLL